MMKNDTRGDVRSAIRAVLAATCTCDALDFLDDGVIIVRSAALPGRLRFPLAARPLQIVTTGASVVVSCHPGRVRWVMGKLGGLDRDAIFSAATIGTLAHYVMRDRQELIGPMLRYACAREDLRPVAIPPGIAITHVAQEDIASLARHRGFDNALSYRSDHPRPDMLATVAHRARAIVGIAGARADSDALWRISVDVIPTARGAGIGRALVGHLTEAVLIAGQIPYYTAAVSDLASRTVAIRLGYWPAWTEMYAKDR